MGVINEFGILAESTDVVGGDGGARQDQSEHQHDAQHQGAIEIFIDTALGIDHAQATSVRAPQLFAGLGRRRVRKVRMSSRHRSWRQPIKYGQGVGRFATSATECLN
jgi:hypothetical protein